MAIAAISPVLLQGDASRTGGTTLIDDGAFIGPSPAAAQLPCPRRGHRLEEGAVTCPACRALGMWPRLDRRKLSRAAPSLDRIARLASRSSSLSPETIRGMLER